jgi:hypothetical protein
VPSRYTLVFLAFATAMVAWVVRGPGGAVPIGVALRRFTGIVLVLGACFLAYRNRVPFEVAFTLPPLDGTFHVLSHSPAPIIDPATDGFGPDSPMLRATMAGRAVLRCNDPLQLPGAVRPDRPVVFSDTVRLFNVRFSPNRVEFGAVTRDEGRVYLNERYVRGWRGSAGDLSIDPATHLAYMMLPVGAAGTFFFNFVPPGLWTGFLLLAAGLALSGLLWRQSLGGAPARTVLPPAAPPS